MAGSPEQFRVVDVPDGQEFLRPGQNFLDQRPIRDIPTILPAGFFKDPHDLAGIATLIRLVRHYAGQDYSEVYSQRASRFAILRPYLPGPVRSGVAYACELTQKFLKDTPYLNQYLYVKWLTRPDLINANGEPLSEVTQGIETFAAYQERLLAVDKKLSVYGINELELGYATGESIRKAVDASGKPEHGRHWRLVVSSEAIK